VCDVAGLGRAGRWELDVRPKVGVGESLEKRGSASLRDACRTIDDEILNESPLVVTVGFERQDNARIVTDIADLPAIGEVPSDDLVPIRVRVLPTTRWVRVRGLSPTARCHRLA
jgi:hypothetical protein